MKIKTHVLALLLYSILFNTLACNREHNSTINDYEQAIEWIDNKNFHSAIISMQAKLTESPKNERARLLAAAAYAGRAGVELRDFINLANLFSSVSNPSNGIEYQDRAIQIIYRIKAQVKDEKVNEVLNTFIKFLEALYRLDIFFQTLDYVPKITSKTQSEDVRMAVRTLNGPDKNIPIKLTEKNSLYRALLRVTLLNYDIHYSYDFSSAFSCKSDIKNLIGDAEDIKHQLSFTLDDIITGSRSNKSKQHVLKYMNEINDVFDQVITQLNSHQGQTFINIVDLTDKQQRKCYP